MTVSLVAVIIACGGCAAKVKDFKPPDEPFQDPPPKEMIEAEENGAIETRLIKPGRRGLKGIKSFLLGDESGEDRLSASFREVEREEKLLDEVEREYPELAGVDYELLKLARETGRLYTLYFASRSVTIKDGHREVITKNGAWLKAFPDTGIKILGHTDDEGTLEYNLAVSQARADAVESFLIDLGITKERITAIAFGEERPVDKRNIERARAKNRRVEFLIVFPTK